MKVRPILKSITVVEELFKDLNVILKNIEESSSQEKTDDAPRTSETTSDTPTKSADQIAAEEKRKRAQEWKAQQIAALKAEKTSDPPSAVEAKAEAGTVQSADSSAPSAVEQTDGKTSTAQGQYYGASKKPQLSAEEQQRRKEWLRQQIEASKRTATEPTAPVVPAQVQQQVMAEASALTPQTARQNSPLPVAPSLPISQQGGVANAAKDKAVTDETEKLLGTEAPPVDEGEAAVREALDQGVKVDPGVLRIYEMRQFLRNYLPTAQSRTDHSHIDHQKAQQLFDEWFGEGSLESILPDSAKERMSSMTLEELARVYHSRGVDRYLAGQMKRAYVISEYGGAEIPSWAQGRMDTDVPFDEAYYGWRNETVKNWHDPKDYTPFAPFDLEYAFGPEIIPGKEPRKKDKKESVYRYLRDEQDPADPTVFIGGDRKKRRITPLKVNSPQEAAGIFFTEAARRNRPTSLTKIPVELVTDEQGNPVLTVGQYVSGKRDEKSQGTKLAFGPATKGGSLPLMRSAWAGNNRPEEPMEHVLESVITDALFGQIPNRPLKFEDFDYHRDAKGGQRLIRRLGEDELIPAFVNGGVDDIDVKTILDRYSLLQQAEQESEPERVKRIFGNTRDEDVFARAFSPENPYIVDVIKNGRVVKVPIVEYALRRFDALNEGNGWEEYVRATDPKGRTLSDEQVKQFADILRKRYAVVRDQYLKATKARGEELKVGFDERTREREYLNRPPDQVSADIEAFSTQTFMAPEALQQPFTPESFTAAFSPEASPQARLMAKAGLTRTGPDGQIQISPEIISTINGSVQKMQQEVLQLSGGQELTPEAFKLYLEKKGLAEGMSPEQLNDYAQKLYERSRQMSEYLQQQESLYRDETASNSGEVVLADLPLEEHDRIAKLSHPITDSHRRARVDRNLEASGKIPGFSGKKARDTVALWKMNRIQHSRPLQAAAEAVVDRIVRGVEPEQSKLRGTIGATEPGVSDADIKTAGQMSTKSMYDQLLQLALKRQAVRAETLFHYGLNPQTNSWRLHRGSMVFHPNDEVNPASSGTPDYSEMDGILESWFDDGAEYIAPRSHALSSWALVDPSTVAPKYRGPGKNSMGIFYGGHDEAPDDVRRTDGILYASDVPDSMVLADFLSQEGFQPGENEFVVMNHPDRPLRSKKQDVKIRIDGIEYTYEQREEARKAWELKKKRMAQTAPLYAAMRPELKDGGQYRATRRQ